MKPYCDFKELILSDVQKWTKFSLLIREYDCLKCSMLTYNSVFLSVLFNSNDSISYHWNTQMQSHILKLNNYTVADNLFHTVDNCILNCILSLLTLDNILKQKACS